ncbi:hypothetical protein EV715DRAFT_245136, partial [Schizophyllum commune]
MPPPALSPRQLATLALGTPRSGRTAAEISTDDRTFTRFRAPAHKHAHHLHSIPPREKSTRTLILDHILWVHALTRLAQARAELGMSDLCPPPPESSSPGPYNPLRPESTSISPAGCVRAPKPSKRSSSPRLTVCPASIRMRMRRATRSTVWDARQRARSLARTKQRL